MACGLHWSLSALAALLCSLLLAACPLHFLPVHAGELPHPKLIQGQCIGKWRRSHGAGHLPPLPSETHGPDGPHWNNSVAICALMKSENSTDVREWLLYYKWLGVDHVYLTENAYRPTPHMRGQLNDFVNEGFLTYEVDGTSGPQLKLYRRCMEHNYHKHNWLAILDLDEFLVLRERPQVTLPQFLDRYKYDPALSVHWVLVGPSGLHTRPASGGVMRHYTHCAGEGSHVIKTIANTFYLSNVAGHAHNAEFRDGRRSVDEKHVPVEPRVGVYVCSATPPALSNQTRMPIPYKNGAHFYEDAGAASNYRHIETVALFHYSTKSQADFAVKIARGASSGGNPKSWEFFEEVSRETQYTGGMCDVPRRLAEQCCSADKLVLHDPWGAEKHSD